MTKILIAGYREEVSKRYELLLWQDGRRFIKANSVVQCLDLVKQTDPDLIIVDSGIAALDVCHELIDNLRRYNKPEQKPILLICEPQRNNEIFSSLLNMVDGVLPLPCDAEEGKQKTSTQH